VPAKPYTLQEFLPIHRARNPVEGEQIRLTLIGFPEGAPRRRTQRLLASAITLGCVGAFVGVSAGNGVVGGIAGTLSGAVLGLVVVPARDQRVGVVVSDRRVVRAQQCRHREPSVEERPRSSVSSATVAPDVERFWSVNVSRVTLSGAGGTVAVLDLPAVGAESLQALLEEAGLEVTVSGSDAGPPGRVRFWFARAFLVGLLYFVGGGYVLLAVPVALDTGGRDALAVLGVAAIVLASAEGLRRLLLRRR
jgi:hypothetical protein